MRSAATSGAEYLDVEPVKSSRNRWFADSPLEGDGSEPSVPVRESATFTFDCYRRPSAGIRDPRGPTAGGDGFEPLVPRRENGLRHCRRLSFHARGLTMSAISDVIAANILVASFL